MTHCHHPPPIPLLETLQVELRRQDAVLARLTATLQDDPEQELLLPEPPTFDALRAAPPHTALRG